MKEKQPLDYKLLGYVDEIYMAASEEYDAADSNIFFFGKIINTDSWMGNKTIDESKYYCQCPCCGALFKLSKKPQNGEYIECPECMHNGYAYDYHNKSCNLVEECFNYAYIETFENGLVLRLFDSKIDYSNRDFDNYETLECIPELYVCEAGREYLLGGKVYYYENNDNSMCFEEGAKETNAINDTDYYIVNYFNDYNPMQDSGLIGDLLSESEPKPKTFIEQLSHQISHKTFKTLQKYGFERLAFEMIYNISLPDSCKISEILQLDYNVIRAKFNVEDFSAGDLNLAHQLLEYGLDITPLNIKILNDINGHTNYLFSLDSPRRIFKYLRHQDSLASKKLYFHDYIDYIKECEKLQYDLKNHAVLYPTNLGIAHSRTSQLVKIENKVEIDNSIAEMYNELHELCEWKDNNLMVIMPHTSQEIIEEGATLNHCVGGYCERVANNESIILFIRKCAEPDKSFYTVEIRQQMNKLSIVQCRGFKNQDPSPEIRNEVDVFLNKYSKWFNTRTTVDMNDQKHRKYYKAVKKTIDGKYLSAWDNKTEYKVGEVIETKMCNDPDKIAVHGIHLASLEFAKKYGDAWDNPAILEIEVNINDIVVPNAKDQVRASKVKVLREVPKEELGEWGIRHP